MRTRCREGSGREAERRLMCSLSFWSKVLSSSLPGVKNLPWEELHLIPASPYQHPAFSQGPFFILLTFSSCSFLNSSAGTSEDQADPSCRVSTICVGWCKYHHLIAWNCGPMLQSPLPPLPTRRTLPLRCITDLVSLSNLFFKADFTCFLLRFSCL